MNPPGFHPAIDELAPRVLHGTADDADRAELARLLAGSPENRRRFLDHTALHGMLAREARAGAFARDTREFFRSMEQPPAPKRTSWRTLWIPAAAAAVVALVAIPLMPMRATAALDRVIAAVTETRDRTYQIEALDERPNEPAAPRTDRGRFPVEGSLNGATLWLRGADQFVLRQSLPNGEVRFIGGHSTESWEIRGKNPARLSNDPARFGGGIIAKRKELAFIDLRYQLGELKRLYQIEWLEKSSSGPWKIRGIRAGSDQGGAKEIELWFDPASGLLERMILRQLPRAHGGPRNISVVLESTDPLPADFFTHTHHQALAPSSPVTPSHEN
jgi:hypothetical protein